MTDTAERARALTRSQRKILRTLAQPQDNAGYVVSAYYGRSVIVVAEPGARGGFRARHRCNHTETLCPLERAGLVTIQPTQITMDEYEGRKPTDYSWQTTSRVTLTPAGYAVATTRAVR